MAEDQIWAGKITKVVHVRFSATAGGDETNLDGCDGYGVLQRVDGLDVFFVDSALQDAKFTELEPGRNVLYLIERGPLGRAAKIWVATSRALIREQEKDAFLDKEPGHGIHNRQTRSNEYGRSTANTDADESRASDAEQCKGRLACHSGMENRG